MNEVAAHSSFWAEKRKKGDKVIHHFPLSTFILKGEEKSSRLLSADDNVRKILRFMCLQVCNQSKLFDSDFCLINTFVLLHLSCVKSSILLFKCTYVACSSLLHALV